MSRLRYIDGLRGVAILLVVAFHAYSRWPEITPYGDTLSEFPLFKYGYLGVQLFFLISGYVIFMSLERVRNPSRFLYKRWLRLFPAMLFCSIFVYASSFFINQRPSGEPELIDLVAGLSLVDPSIWHFVTGIRLESIEGAFWSLYVEFKFYVIAAMFYYLWKSEKLVHLLFVCFLSSASLQYLNSLWSVDILSTLLSISYLLSLKYFGWFAAGAAFYLFNKTERVEWYYYGVFMCLLSSLVESQFDFYAFIAASLVSAVFAISLISSRLQSLLCTKTILYFGFISYPLYLIHENMIISLTRQIYAYIGDVIPSTIIPIIVVFVVSAVAHWIAKSVEPRLTQALSSGLGRLPLPFAK